MLDSVSFGCFAGVRRFGARELLRGIVCFVFRKWDYWPLCMWLGIEGEEEELMVGFVGIRSTWVACNCSSY